MIELTRPCFFSTYTAIDSDPFELLGEVEDSGFDGFEILSESRHDIRKSDAVEEFDEASSSVDIDLTVHAPISDMNFATLNGEIWEVVVSQLKEVVEASAVIGAHRVTLHPGHYSPLGERYPERAQEKNLSALRSLAEKASKVGVSLSVENLAGIDVFLGRTPEEVFGMVEETGIDFTLDIGHAFIEEELGNFIDSPERVDHLHLHDNEGGGDDHLPIGDGKIPFEGLRGFLGELDAIRVIEGRSLEEGRKSLSRLKDLTG